MFCASKEDFKVLKKWLEGIESKGEPRDDTLRFLNTFGSKI